MPKPKTAKLTLEITNDDGSKTRIVTADLDASKLRENSRKPEDDPDHIVLGMKDPWYDESDYFERRDRWVTDTLRIPTFPDSHFFLDLQLEPVKKGSAVYTIEKIEAPATNIVMIFNANKPVMCAFDEKVAAEKAENFGTSGPYAPIYFLLDIP